MWTAEITNDPDRDGDLYVELLLDDKHVARFQRNEAGEIELRIYDASDLTIPWSWLRGLVDRFEREVPVGGV